MNDWINGDCDRADDLAAQDPYCQDLCRQLQCLEPRYERFLQTLTEEDRDFLTDYIYLTTEIAYQKTQAAYLIGKSRRNS